MTDWRMTVSRTLTQFVTVFVAAGGFSFVTGLFDQFPPETIIYGSITIASLAAIWRMITNAYKHRDD